jgi:CheY-like chemotaxis protein
MSKSVIFLVDDEVALRELIAELLRDEGYEVYQFADGQKALIEAQSRISKNLKIDLVLSDVNMPVMSGVALTAELRKIPYDNPIILLSGESGEEFEQLKRTSGVTGVECKPYNTNELLSKIAEFINSPNTTSS